MVDPRRLRATELVRLLNSTPLGEVLTESTLRDHRARAGMQLDGPTIDLLRYLAWLARQRHTPSPPAVDPTIVAEATAIEADRLSSKQQEAIRLILTERSYAAVAVKAGVAESTLYRWLKQPEFRNALVEARRRLVDTAIGRLQAATGVGVDALIKVANQGRRDADRTRAAIALIQTARQGLPEASRPSEPLTANQVVELLTNRLREVDRSDLPIAEKTRLTASLSDALLRALRTAQMNDRIEAIDRVLRGRGEGLS